MYQVDSVSPHPKKLKKKLHFLSNVREHALLRAVMGGALFALINTRVSGNSKPHPGTEEAGVGGRIGTKFDIYL
jgi:hypothetical protein